ncbi:L,D-transpeptidase family protein [Litchfieldia salsa]|uniref:LysM domain-containing protein n=1 Tax=Litchfieldia salsa TaxID=930152 RepID=A0A1H0RVZ9_9BACI|nr:L,D-transpeptidase family protein [Litchfieldia salsa]SDP33654.1 LysM domain-containing protein [Litchfieldia salsa]
MKEELNQSRKTKFSRKRNKKSGFIFAGSFFCLLLILIVNKQTFSNDQQQFLALNSIKESKKETLLLDSIQVPKEQEIVETDAVKETSMQEGKSLNHEGNVITEVPQEVLETTNESSNPKLTPITMPSPDNKHVEIPNEIIPVDIKPANKVMAPKQLIIEHIVSKSQTAFGISKLYYLTNEAQTILTFNGITNPSNGLKEGMKIKIPNPDIIAHITVKKGDTLFSISNTQYSKSNYLAFLMEFNGIHQPEVDFKIGNNLYIPTDKQVITHQIKPKQTIYSIMNQYYDLPSIQSKIASFNRFSNVNKDIKVNMVIKIPNLFKANLKNPPAPKEVDKNLYIEINRAKNELSLFNKGKVIYKTKVATGQNWSTPKGTFTVSIKFVNPYYTPRKIAGGDPSNPLGTRWLGLSIPGTEGRTYGIHGTNKPSSIGGFASIGCIRMLNEEIEWLYDKIPIGTKVIIL